MGLYDTIILPKPVKCSLCEYEIKDFQTKQFESLLIYYELGDVISGSLDGIFENHLYCDNCAKNKLIGS